LTARTPKIQEMPNMGRSTATALTVSLETNQMITIIISSALKNNNNVPLLKELKTKKT